ncbi:hypothetical protein LRB11_09585 [Ectothiorhodospira haloalkaliphila]|uniref:hypothetical protein n=1 Tax=Ectothiorhodospira haloalkaliphila TaxID=421628 RepID=UPI001EE7FCD4|nr:hypothetical protein [Ectothiorhodospira haloalkaliphila]MCG5525178.1 hypothetical protein [Ectothiorhodospira haloalkaliphila]
MMERKRGTLSRPLRITDINLLDNAQIQAEMDRARAAALKFFLFPHRLADGSLRHVEVYSGPIELRGRTPAVLHHS